MQLIDPFSHILLPIKSKVFPYVDLDIQLRDLKQEK